MDNAVGATVFCAGMTLAELLSRAWLDETTGCLNWQRLTGNWYGMVYVDGTRHSVHRLAFQLANPGINIAGLFVCHHCDNRRCINPAHLYAGTQSQNIEDCVVRGRHAHGSAKGEKTGQAKLKDSFIPAIRKRIDNGESCVQIAKDYGVSHTVIYDIKHHKLWRHI